MAKRLSEQAAIEVGLEPQTVDNTNVTGDYFHMADWQRSLWILQCGAMAASKTTKIEIYEAIDSGGTSAQLVSGATATITANTLVTEMTVALASAASTDVVTINGTDYVMAGSTTVASRTFQNAAGLVTCVNHATYGVSGVVASADGTTVTLKVNDPASTAITVTKTENSGTITLATVSAQAFVDLDTSDLSLSTNFEYVAAKVTSTATTVAGVTLLRYGGRFTPTQRVGSSATV